MSLDHYLFDLWPVLLVDAREYVKLALLNIEFQKIYALHSVFADNFGKGPKRTSNIDVGQAMLNKRVDVDECLITAGLDGIGYHGTQVVAIMRGVLVPGRLSGVVWIKREF